MDMAEFLLNLIPINVEKRKKSERDNSATKCEI